MIFRTCRYIKLQEKFHKYLYRWVTNLIEKTNFSKGVTVDVTVYYDLNCKWSNSGEYSNAKEAIIALDAFMEPSLVSEWRDKVYLWPRKVVSQPSVTSKMTEALKRYREATQKLSSKKPSQDQSLITNSKK